MGKNNAFLNLTETLICNARFLVDLSSKAASLPVHCCRQSDSCLATLPPRHCRRWIPMIRLQRHWDSSPMLPRSTPKPTQRSKRVKNAVLARSSKASRARRPLPARFSPARACLRAVGARFGNKRADSAPTGGIVSRDAARIGPSASSVQILSSHSRRARATESGRSKGAMCPAP